MAADREMKPKVLEEMDDLANQGKCPGCKCDMKNHKFKDALSFKEFQISGLCQECQDSVFGNCEEFDNG